MAERTEFPPGDGAAWSKIRRNGNDEVPARSKAVQVIRKVQTKEPQSLTNQLTKSKTIQTKVAKLIYEPKNIPSLAVIKSTNTYTTLKGKDKGLFPPSRKGTIKNQSKKSNVLQSNIDIENPEISKQEFNFPRSDHNFDEEKKIPDKEEIRTNIGIEKSEMGKEKFILKKKDRENDIAEIQEMLKQINNVGIESEEKQPKNVETPVDLIQSNENEPPNPVENIISTKEQNEKQIMSPSKVKEIQPITRSRKSKTDIDLIIPQIKILKSASTTKRSSRSIGSKSSPNLNADNFEEPKKKSYSSEEARKFMEKQKNKRKKEREKELSAKADNASSTVNRDAIKKRLEELRKNSLKILDKNLKKGKKLPSTPIEKREERIKETVILKQAPPTKTVQKPVNTKKNRPVNHLPIQNKKIGLLRKLDSEDMSLSSMKEINFDKENIISEMETKLINISKIKEEEKRDALTTSRINSNGVASIPPDNTLKESLKLSEEADKSSPVQASDDQDVVEELQLSVPNVKLNTNVYREEKSIQVNTMKSEKPQIPYWLKPTPVQIYPYNFIMAVRKKLEAIANPVLSIKNIDNRRDANLNYQKTPVSQSKEYKKSFKGRPSHEQDFQEQNGDVSQQQIQQIKKNSPPNLASYTPIQSVSENIKTSYKHNASEQKQTGSQKSFSEIESNFSSISLHLPESNTISEISSIRSEANRYISALSSTKIPKVKVTAHREDDTTISSSIFSSPEKRPTKVIHKRDNAPNPETIDNQEVSPLSIKNISKLQIKSKTLDGNITATRGDNLSIPLAELDNASRKNILNIPLTQLDNTLKSNKKDTPKVDTVVEFEQLLEDFNKSLSQVIDVNQQIKSALSNSPNISDRIKSNEQNLFRIEPKKVPSTGSIKSKTEIYSSDFEELITTNETKIRSSDESRNEAPDKNLETIANVNHYDSTSISNNKSSTSISTAIGSSGNNENISSQLSDFTTRQKKNSIIESPQNDHLLLAISENNKSLTPSRNSVGSEEFFDSIEEMSKTKSDKIYYQTENSIFEKNENDPENELIKNSINVDNTSSQVNVLQSYVNVTRGDFLYQEKFNEETSERAPPAYQKNDSPKNVINSSFGSSEMFAIFNQSDLELSVVSQTGSLSEATLNYSSIGLYEQLLQAETIKSDHLSLLLKMREKALMDRTKGQIAWLEVQKEKYKAKGLTLQISAIKKKQRAILLKMEKEREEIKRLHQIKTNKKENGKMKLIRPPLRSLSDVSIRKSSSSPKICIKGQELKPNHSLELILQKREQELRERRTHVERLVEWHQRLDREEEEVLQLEQMLLNSNSQINAKLPKELKKQKRIEDIDNSIKELQNISSRSDEIVKSDYVRATGHKLNKLWRRLTGQKVQKFTPAFKYKLSKKDLENLYEEAKNTVLRDFGQDDEMKQLLDLSKLDFTSNSNRSLDTENNESLVPQLNLNFSSGQSDVEKSISSEVKGIGKNKSVPEPLVNSNENEVLPFVGNCNAIDITSNSSNSVKKQHDSINESERVENDFLENVDTTKSTPSIAQPPQEKELMKDQSDKVQSHTENDQKYTDSIHTTSKIVSSDQLNIQNTDAEKVDTVAEIPSLSYDSNNSFEDSSKISLKNEEILFSHDQLHRNSNPVSDVSAVTIQNSCTFIEHESQSRSSVIVSNILSSIVVNIANTEANSKSLEMEIQGTQNESFPTYTVSVNNVNTNTDENCIDEKENTASNSVNFTSIHTIQAVVSKENSIDSTKAAENTNKEQLNHVFEIESLENETFIEDISLPKFESTIEDSKSYISEDLLSARSRQLDESKELEKSDKIAITSELEKRLIDIDDSLKGLHQTFERALSPEKSPSSSRSRSPSQTITEDEKENIPVNHINTNVPSIKENVKNPKANKENSTILMPDIINEVEIRRRQQILLESDLKQLEHAVPYVFLREIPNKPPPPYVPPAHGSPMTTIFPSEQRIEEITFRRVKELYEEITKTDLESDNNPKVPSIMEENITNIYERIILDICKEMMQDLQPTLSHPNPQNYKNQLSLYNPPDRLKCLQNYVYKHVRKLLAMDRKNLKRNSITCIGRRNHIDEILVQELFEEEHKWTNFDLEECEVKKALTDEIFNDIVKEVIDELIDAHKKKVHKVVEYNKS